MTTHRHAHSAGARLRFVQMRLGRLAPNVRGALWVLLGCVLFTCMGTLVKLLSASFDSFQLAFFRAAFGLLAVLPFRGARAVHGATDAAAGRACLALGDRRGGDAVRFLTRSPISVMPMRCP